MTDSSTQGPWAKPIDWVAIRRRLDEVWTAVERGRSLAPAERKKILETRAQALAQPPSELEAPEQRIEVIEFCLGAERYGVEASFVREVFLLTDLTRLPCTPPFVLGIINVRGEIVSLIDLRRFFDLPDKGLTDLNKVIVLHSDSMLFGILADRIVGMRTVLRSELQASLPALTAIPEAYLTGVTKDRTVLLDAAKLLADSKIIVHEDIPT